METVNFAWYIQQLCPADKHGPLLRVNKQRPCFKAIEEDGGDKRLVELELAGLRSLRCCTARYCLVWPLLSNPDADFC